ncbi:FKBP-type peptidyl-prolyl cis-trans isomerase [Mucilaginibacter sp. UR6-1]|uniref:FKBP-type peptidyl-prolyl cis-trans isomerase n=1 Tax=Mucilaginibacter sp. UR6-1 TaxID=1435643 RepID=UPI001E2A01E2|nr:FKBP-type peptidyl-prolyl cis-trans isomerase [Mucilaginibacter sp. UR6-1]MCC8408339.1 FKBP-type peptidyl-prolyl cis-trans isomerase [Mucilaginibacter sp. UR6-1]
MKKGFMFFALAALAMASCNGGFKQAPGGLLYNIHNDKEGTTIKEGDFLAVNVITKNDADSVLSSTYDAGNSAPVLMQKPQAKGDIYAALQLLSEGDSATIKMNIDSVFPKGQRPPQLKGKYLVYEMKVEKVISKGKLSDQVFQGRISEYFKKQSEDFKKREPALISKYIAEKDLKVTKTPSGLNYVVTKQGSGPQIIEGDTAVVNYTGRLLSGKVFDTSVKEVAEKEKIANPMRKYEPIRVPVGSVGIIKGWADALVLLNKGAKGTFVIPSSLAYGEQGSPNVIPPYSPLAFEIEVVDVVKPKAGAAPQAVAPAPVKK